jgi:hypothetical protein
MLYASVAGEISIQSSVDREKEWKGLTEAYSMHVYVLYKYMYSYSTSV